MLNCFINRISHFPLPFIIPMTNASHITLFKNTSGYFHIVHIVIGVLEWIHSSLGIIANILRKISTTNINNLRFLLLIILHIDNLIEHLLVPINKTILPRLYWITIIIHSQEYKNCVRLVFVLVMIWIYLWVTCYLSIKYRHYFTWYSDLVFNHSFSWLSLNSILCIELFW